MDSGALDFRDRRRVLDGLDGESFDLIVIGAGVTGAGVARDAAMRGLKVALVEARDFASGTSSRSSKMIHGGLRYMAQGDLALVHEAASERKAVERIAPHLTRQTPFVIPAKTPAVTAKLRAGLWAFEKLGSVPKDRRHEVWTRRDLELREPTVEAREFSGAVVYPEYLTEDARLTLANVRSAKAYGAQVISYAPVRRLIVENGKAVGVVLSDALSSEDADRARLSGRVIVNAAGPWVDAVRRLEDGAARTQLQLTKGVHVVVPRHRLPVSRTIIMPASDRRSVFAVPKGEFTYLGTTDTFYPESDYWPAIEAADVDYLLAAAQARFATPPLGHQDIVAAWSGVRPLVAQEGKSASDISRKDEVWTGPAGVLSIAGGKLTAYRKMAERIVDMVQQAIGQEPLAAATAQTPLIGGDLDPAVVLARLEPKLGSRDAAERLVGLYGAEAEDLAAGGAGPIVEARHAVLFEGAVTLEDYWVRRSARAWFDHNAGLDALGPAATEMAGLLGWSPQETNRQIDACRALNTASRAALHPVKNEA
ncbi:glycerol-3-phosphate dehydrogenase/oxidase [Phenylobacterium sp.]|jgi:glycerol-3-phosphate dehydrogenase|uniref:glycerol-3-phosphate dehydrogenase/oxidase n=1 Tax=Phenylobacterium sp. TaxID=1871053 RepID=UPI002F3EFA2B